MNYLRKLFGLSKNDNIKVQTVIISKEDECAKKYIDKIYEDYNLNKDLNRVNIIRGESIEYIISDAANNTFLNCINYTGNIMLKFHFKGEHAVDFTGYVRHSTQGWISISVIDAQYSHLLVKHTRYYDYHRAKLEGKDSYSHFPVSSKMVKDLIQFFKNEFIEKYPYMKFNHSFDKCYIKTNIEIKKICTDYIAFEEQ